MRTLFSILFLIIFISPVFAEVTSKKESSRKGASEQKLLVGYYESWSEPWVSDPTKSKLANVAPYVSVVNLSFMQPDANYVAGSYNLAGTGLQFPYDGFTLKQVIQQFKKTHPKTKLLVAVGGATYHNWDQLNVAAISAFVKDYELDGVDVDLETSPGCARGQDQHIHCASDQKYIQIVKSFRQAMPSPKWVTIAAWSIGAYGEDQWVNSQPQGDYTGMMLALLREMGDQIDMLNVMSYDAGNKMTTGYDPLEALNAYQYYYKGKLAMGVEVSPESWGGNISSLQDVETLAQAVKQKNAAGMMLWSLQKRPNSTPTPQIPDANMIGKAICSAFGLNGCDQPVS